MSFKLTMKFEISIPTQIARSLSKALIALGILALQMYLLR